MRERGRAETRPPFLKMSVLRKHKKLVNDCNQLLGQELGRNPHGGSRYEWRFSEDWVRPKRAYSVVADEKLVPEYEYVMNPNTGIIEPKPKYLTEKVCVDLVNQWIMSVWLPSEDFVEWRLKYGDSLEWPKQGDYWPVSHPTGVVCLDPEHNPTIDITREFIRIVRKDKAEIAGFEDKFTALQESKDKAELERLRTGILEVLPVYDGIPGSRQYPIWPGALTKPDPRIKGNLWMP